MGFSSVYPWPMDHIESYRLGFCARCELFSPYISDIQLIELSRTAYHSLNIGTTSIPISIFLSERRFCLLVYV